MVEKLLERQWFLAIWPKPDWIQRGG